MSRCGVRLSLLRCKVAFHRRIGAHVRLSYICVETMTVAQQTGAPPAVARYLLYGEIASGGMATVHFGRLQGAAGFVRSVAIKRLHPQYAKDPDFVAMFLDEARLAARIAHPNVVPTLDVVSQGDELLLVMEYVRGSALSRLLRTLAQKGERMPLRIAASIAAGVLRGLHAAHEAKSEIGEPLDIVHRDVSPQNVLVGTDGIARVLDFGVAKAAGRVQTTREGQLKGKLAYMAPEQITTGSVTRKTDVYAASVVLWEMLTGRRLFRADNEGKLLSLVLDSEVAPPSELIEGLPEGFDRVVLRGLDRDPAKRYATARDMAIDLEVVVGTAPSSEVGEWVEIVAADELHERANRIEEIERSVRTATSSSVSNAWTGPGASLSGVGRRSDETATVQHGGRAQTGTREASAPASPASQVSQVSHLSMAHTDPPPRSRRRSVGIAAAVAIALFAVGATVLALRASHSSSTAPATASGPAAPLPRAPTAVSVEATPEPVLPAVSTTTAAPTLLSAPAANPPQASVAIALEGSAPASPRPPPKAPPTVASLAAVNPSAPATTVPPVYSPPPPLRRPAAPADCSPPYTTDSKGHIHFKPACVN
jgi:serine/threonine-protein kinase